MNIILPHSWLSEYLNTNAPAEKISECLSLCGPSVEKLIKTKTDYLYEIEVTTNRVDMMSVIGIAREAAAILPGFGFQAKFIPPKIPPKPVSNNKFPLEIKIEPNLCPRFSAVVIKNINLKPSPPKISYYLENSGIRSLNNIVDISNYLMRLFGQPVHTFDFDKIKARMILRLSKPGEIITTLDKKQHVLPGNDIVIEDGTGQIIDLCGIMGGYNSAIDKNTKNVLLFVQTYNPINIRQTSMKLGHRTEAAQLFEKGLDPEMVMPTLLTGIQLFKLWADGNQGSQIIDLYPNPPKPKRISFSLQLIKDRLGVEISQSEVDKILASLGFHRGLVPSWRAKDINLPEDIVEEIARIYGYHRLPSQLMTGAIPTNYPDENFNLEHQIKLHLVSLGAIELYTNSMVSKKIAQASGIPLAQHLKIKNALSKDWLYLRRSLIPSHQAAIQANPQAKNITFFEIANTYKPNPKGLPKEELTLIISSNQGYFHLKGIVESLSACLHTPIKANITTDSAVILLRPVLKSASLYPRFQPISNHPAIIEDLTFVLPEKTPLGPILKTIKTVSRLVKSVELTQIYQQNFTFTLNYQSLTKDLSSLEIAPIRKKIIETLERKFTAKLIGALR